MSEQVSADLPTSSSLPLGSFRFLESFEDAAAQPVIKTVRERMRGALQHFPELSGETVTVARRQQWDDRLGRADMLNRIVYLPWRHHTSWTTMYHELGHLVVQVRDEDGQDVPTSSEEYCSLLALSRMPAERIDEGRVPYFPEPEIPESEWPTVAACALRYRQEHRNYIQQAKRWFSGEEEWRDWRSERAWRNWREGSNDG